MSAETSVIAGENAGLFYDVLADIRDAIKENSRSAQSRSDIPLVLVEDSNCFGEVLDGSLQVRRVELGAAATHRRVDFADRTVDRVLGILHDVTSFLLVGGFILALLGVFHAQDKA